ncbi:MAG TPA: exodeoxyribonuclease VII large subunit, partial [Anaeromyxobacter sp.]
REVRALRAELADPAHLVSRERHRLDDLLHRGAAALRAPGRRRRDAIERLRARLSRQDPRQRVRETLARMEAATRRLGAWQARTFRAETMRLERLRARLEPANVAKLLGRGFALVLERGHVVARSARLSVGDAVRIALAEGWVDARVTALDAGEDPLPGRGRPGGDGGPEGPPLTPPSGVVK